MCGRYTLTVGREDLAAAFPLDEAPGEIPERYNVAPTQHVAVIANRKPRRVEFFHWGLIPFWADDPKIGNRMINARAETLAEKPSFRNAFRRRRCLVLADGFYEWTKRGGKKWPLYLRMKSGEPFAFAGLWERWSGPGGEEVESCTIVTTEANDLVAGFHDRMPVILRPGDYEAWLDPEERDPEELSRLLAPFPSELLEVRPVGRVVNDPSNDRPECVEPIEPPG
ncbi:MAG: SOS response-associated peptidase [Gemmatimonadota bacterium]|nr:SOS response-associated peptidase [Gemmatimonadota bacterium]